MRATHALSGALAGALFVGAATGAASCGDHQHATGGASASSSSASSSSSTSKASSSATGLPPSFSVTGTVVDQDGAPVDGAIVMQGGTTPNFMTGPDGSFTITMDATMPGTPTIVAAKIGYRAAGDELYDLPVAPMTLTLVRAAPPDNYTYVYGDPGVGDASLDNSTKYCGHCHTRYVADFQTSAHAKATRDPLVQDLYAGVANQIASASACATAGGSWKTGLVPGQPTQTMSKCYVGNGVLPDLNGCGMGQSLSCDDPSLTGSAKPTVFGACADCHGAGIDGKAGGRNLHESTGISFKNGNHCDVCHHVRDVDTSSSEPGIAGRLVLQRPSEHRGTDIGAPLLQVMFGPYPDVPNTFMGGSYQPKFKSAELCSGCHEYNQKALLPGAAIDASKWPNGLPTLSTYSEWTASPFNTPDSQCQTCHMPQIDGMFNDIDVSSASDADIAFGFGRPKAMRAHIFQGPLSGTPRLIDPAIAGSIAATQSGASLNVEVSIKNTFAGHAIPTSEPMRSLVLAVEVQGCGQTFVSTGGLTVPDFGGSIASGDVGGSITMSGAMLSWPTGAPKLKVGDRIRFVRPSGAFVDYPGIGYFANPGLTPAQKGMPAAAPVGEADVISIVGSSVTLSAAVPTQTGDVVFAGDAAPMTWTDGDPSRALAGAAGFAFARVMLDPSGARFVPHYRAVDIASDNRLPPQATAKTQHVFAIPAGCASATVGATILYRPLPLAWSRERSWGGRDYVVMHTSQNVTLQ